MAEHNCTPEQPNVPTTSARFIEVGMRFYRWEVLALAPDKKHRRHWLCRCDCGEEADVSGGNLVSSKTKSCGCFSVDTVRARSTIHGYAPRSGQASEYTAWLHIHARCYDRGCSGYHNYGGRGIYVCARWSGPSGFANFLVDMGTKPTREHSIERTDNNGPYSPENCIWGTTKEQSRNKRSNRLIEFQGRVQCLVAWAEEVNLPPSAIRIRLDKLGWSVEHALTQRLRVSKRRTK